MCAPANSFDVEAGDDTVDESDAGKRGDAVFPVHSAPVRILPEVTVTFS